MRTVPALVVALLLSLSPAVHAAEKTAILAGGCFWCIEKDMEHVNGVVDVVSGYTGGTSKSPTYRNHSGHREAVLVTFDDSKISYERLLHIFWRTVDPTDGGGQFCDRGHSYSTAVYVFNEEQRKVAEASKNQAATVLKTKIATPIEAASNFTRAEEYHQNYSTKNPIRYKYYRYRCGRDQRVKELWGQQAYTDVDYSS